MLLLIVIVGDIKLIIIRIMSELRFIERNSGNGITLSKISEIDPSTIVMYNSDNVFVGRRSSGKTYTCIK
jgi:hypothetical protein